MKIYNKRSFGGAVLCLFLALCCGAALIVTGFQMKWLTGMVVALAMGGVELWWALSRQPQLPRVDERDEAVSRKSAWMAFRVVVTGCWGASMAALAVYAVIRTPAALVVLVTLAAVVIAAFLALLGANLYYEKRM